MAVFEALTPAERAGQLRNPEGAVGLAVAEWLNEINRAGNARIVALLGVGPGSHVLEIGFGNGRTVPDVIAQAAEVHYTGLDFSPTMVEEATRFNAALVAAGCASFHLGSAERMPFADASFDRVFSTGVAHFWADPVGPLAQVRRVLRPSGVSLMGCLQPRAAPDFARLEYGVHLHDATAWDAAYRAAGFAGVDIATVEFEQAGPDGASIRRYGFLLAARA